MSVSASDYPSQPEIAAQLEKALASQLFAKARNQAQLLRYIATETFAGRRVDPARLAHDLYPASRQRRNFDRPFTGHKADIHLVRKKLLAFNNAEGGPVFLDLSPFEYGLVAWYSSEASVLADYQRGLECLENSYRVPLKYGLYRASYYFRRGVSMGYAPAAAALGEVIIWEICIRGTDRKHELQRQLGQDEDQEFEPGPPEPGIESVVPDPDVDWFSELFPEPPDEAAIELVQSGATIDFLPEWLDDAEKLAFGALRTNPLLWRAHLVLGVSAMTYGSWRRAARHFTDAVKFDAQATHHTFHLAYLAIVGNHAAAISSAEQYAKLRPDDFAAPLKLSFCLYLADRYDDAFRVILRASDDIDSWLLLLLQGLLYIELNHGIDAEWGESCIEFAQDSIRRCRGGKTNLFTGIQVAAFSMCRMVLEAQAKLELLEDLGDGVELDDIQLAIAYTALGDYKLAVDCLEQAYYFRNPLVAMIRRVPLFKALHTYAGYRAFSDKIYRMLPDSVIAPD